MGKSPVAALGTKRVIIYVFGPESSADDYYAGKILTLPFGWLKIGMTIEDNPSVDKWDSANKRVSGIAKTGIPVPVRIYDVFEYPLMPCTSGHVDDKIRRILAREIYTLPTANDAYNDVRNNSPYVIKGGTEFVYEVSRSMVLAAIKVFEHDLMLCVFDSCASTDEEAEQQNCCDMFKQLLGVFKSNVPEDLQVAESDTSSNEDVNCDWPGIWEHVAAQLPDDIRGMVVGNKHDRNYLDIKVPRGNAQISVRVTKNGTIAFRYAVLDGETGRDEVDDYINKSGIVRVLPGLNGPLQGQKNKDIWFWTLTFPTPDDTAAMEKLIAEKIIKIYRAFEKA